MKVRIGVLLFALTFFAFSGLVSSFFPGADRTIRLLTAGLDVLVIVMAGSVLWRNRSYYGTWLWVALVFGALLTLAYNFDRFGPVAQFNGLRPPLFFLSSLVILEDVFRSEYRARLVRHMTIFLLIFAFAQIPTSLMQFISFGASDSVGGTYGTGGGSGLITQVLFLLTFYFLVRYGSLDEGTNFSFSKMLLFSILLVPVLLNETKISFVLLAMMVVLVTFSPRKLYKTIPFLILGVMLFAVFVYYYTQTVMDPTQYMNEKFVERYLYSAPKAEQQGDIPRLMRVVLMMQLFQDDMLALVIGMGYGIFGGGTVLGVSQLARSLYYLTSGSRILLVTVWMQGGIIALFIILWGVFGFMRSKIPLSWTLKRFRIFLFASLALMWIYNEAILDRTFAGVVTFLMVWVSYGGQDAEAESSGAAESQDETTGVETA